MAIFRFVSMVVPSGYRLYVNFKIACDSDFREALGMPVMGFPILLRASVLRDILEIKLLSRGSLNLQKHLKKVRFSVTFKNLLTQYRLCDLI